MRIYKVGLELGGCWAFHMHFINGDHLNVRILREAVGSSKVDYMWCQEPNPTLISVNYLWRKGRMRVISMCFRT